MYKVQTASPIKTAASLCKNRISDNHNVNFHMFMNSVKGIAQIIGKAGLTPENCRVVCSNSKENLAKLPEGFTISTSNDPVKPVNFYTSTCFEGCDIMDEYGRTFIICDPHKPNTLLDISTSMLQICGRIRDSKYKEEMTLIYNTTRYEEEETLEQYIERIDREKAEAEKDAEWLNNGPDTRMRRLLLLSLKQFDAPFIQLDNNKGEVIIDQNMINLDIINYKVIHGMYNTQVNLDEEIQKADIEIKKSYVADCEYVELMTQTNMSFKDCCEKYAEVKPLPGTFSFKEDEQLVRLKSLCPEACYAVDKLGIEEIRRMKYRKSNVLRKLAEMPGPAQEVRIKRELDRRLSKFRSYTVPEIKKILGEVYEDVHLVKTPVATDLDR